MENSFNNLNIKKDILKTLEDLKYTILTDVQKQSLPLSLDNKDIIVQSNTSSGKTLCFCIPILNKLKTNNFSIQSIVLAPTRELANQISIVMKSIARFTNNIKITTLCGGVPYKPQVHSLSHKAHIIIGTPGRILKHLNEQSFTTNNIDTLVLDEADKMLDMGFYEDINKIIDYLPKQRQTLLFSATYPCNIEELSQSITNNSINIKIKSNIQPIKIDKIFYDTTTMDKNDILLKVIKEQQKLSNIIFCNTKVGCNELSDYLHNQDIDTLVLHSDLDQKQRDETLILFSNKSFPILIATDVASRGIDINNIDLVINYDLPFDNEVYTHRIGRTARSGKNGCAISLVDDNSIQMFNELNINNNYKLLNPINIKYNKDFNIIAPYKTLFINSGKKNKIRAGDILGALTAGLKLNKNDVGKIDILPFCSFVAIKEDIAQTICDKLNNTKIKAKYHKVYLI